MELVRRVPFFHVSDSALCCLESGVCSMSFVRFSPESFYCQTQGHLRDISVITVHVATAFCEEIVGSDPDVLRTT